MYCPKCGSRLYPDDEKYMQYAGVCSGCVCYDRTPDKRYQKAYADGVKAATKYQRKARRMAYNGR